MFCPNPFRLKCFSKRARCKRFVHLHNIMSIIIQIDPFLGFHMFNHCLGQLYSIEDNKNSPSSLSLLQ
uniref:Ovule protein n=1 Tax=Meloidogyne incognita TaxID=6306 RepID=A0A914KWZ4_MELIC